MVTGLRPGEKLYEERLMKEEGLKKTSNDMISIGKPIKFDEKNFIDKIEELYKLARKESEGMKDLVKELVPTYVVYKGKK
jgi:FlaA1/EpsC-like NDP-sugar epimerase